MLHGVRLVEADLGCLRAVEGMSGFNELIPHVIVVCKPGVVKQSALALAPYHSSH